MSADEWEWEQTPFTPSDLYFIERYAAQHYGQISTLVVNETWNEYTFRAVLTDFLLGAVVNAANPKPQDKK